MQRHSVRFALSLMGLLLSLFTASVARAQNTYANVQASGTYLVNGGTTQIKANVSKAYYASTGTTSTWGNMTVLTPKIYAKANVLTASFSWIVTFGIRVQHCSLVSQSFNYYPPLSQNSVPAHVVVYLTQFGTYGRGGYQLISDVDGTIYAESSINGLFAESAFTGTSNYVIITE